MFNVLFRRNNIFVSVARMGGIFITAGHRPAAGHHPRQPLPERQNFIASIHPRPSGTPAGGAGLLSSLIYASRNFKMSVHQTMKCCFPSRRDGSLGRISSNHSTRRAEQGQSLTSTRYQLPTTIRNQEQRIGTWNLELGS
jgi:hypothetical protein